MFSFPYPPLPVSATDRGMTTAEYAVCTVAAVALAGVLYYVVTSGTVSDALNTIIIDALQSGS